MSRTHAVASKSGSDLITKKSSQKRAGEKLVFSGKTDAITSGIVAGKKTSGIATGKETVLCSGSQKTDVKSTRTKGVSSYRHKAHRIPSVKGSVSSKNSLRVKEKDVLSAGIYVSEHKGATTIRRSSKAGGVFAKTTTGELLRTRGLPTTEIRGSLVTRGSLRTRGSPTTEIRESPIPRRSSRTRESSRTVVRGSRTRESSKIATRESGTRQSLGTATGRSLRTKELPRTATRGSSRTKDVFSEKDATTLVPIRAYTQLPRPSATMHALYRTKARVDKCLAYKSKATTSVVYATQQGSNKELIRGVSQTKASSQRKKLGQKQFLLEDGFVAAIAANRGTRFETFKRLQNQKISKARSATHFIAALMSESDELRDAEKAHETIYRGGRVYKNYRSVAARRKGRTIRARGSRARMRAQIRAARIRAARNAASRRAVIRKVVKTRAISRIFPHMTRVLSPSLGLGKFLAGLISPIMPFLCAILFFFSLTSALGAMAAHNSALSLPSYITSEMVEAALEAQERHGHPAGATLAQIILESGMGDHLSRLATEDNNLFGMKSGGPDGGFYRRHPEVLGSSVWDTYENYDGESVEIQDYFLSFTSVRDCILFRSRVFLQHPTYADNPLIKEAIEEHSSDKMVQGLKSAGYATSDSYVSDLLAILDAYNLRRFDHMGLKDFKESRQAIIGALADGPLSEAQQKIVKQAYATASPGKGLCAKYISWVFRDAGYGYPTGNACDMYRSWCHSSDLSELKPGMICAVPSYGKRSSPGHTYGHIGIYVGGGKIRDNIGAIRDSDLSDWLRYYGTEHAPRWGWVFGIDLSTQ